LLFLAPLVSGITPYQFTFSSYIRVSLILFLPGAFWLAYAATLQDGFYGAMSAYTPTTGPNAGVNAGLYNPGFAQSFAFFLLFMSLLSFVFLICSIRTNVVFFIIFLMLILTFACLAASFW
jgi:uncharacterized protein